MTDPSDMFSQPPSPEKRPNRFLSLLKRPWFILLCAFLIVVGVIGSSVNSIMRALLHSREEVIVPKLEGKNLADALSIASPLDLALQQEGTEFDESLPAGTVVRQHPPAGMQVRAGRSIRIVVSKGGEVVFVPLVIGKSLPEAQSILAAERLQIGVVSEAYSSDAQRGMVLDQMPSTGSIVTRGALVDVRVSKGLPPAGLPLLPDFFGQPVDQAEQWARDVNAEVKVIEDAEAVGVSGTVVRQEPPPGQPLLEGEAVQLTIVPAESADRQRITFGMPDQFPDGSELGTVRIMARNADGETVIYEGQHPVGTTVEVPVRVLSTTRFRFYVNDLLEAEQVIEP